MKSPVHLFVLFLLIPLVSITSMTNVDGNTVPLQSDNLTVSFNSTEVTIYRNESAFVKANVELDSQPLIGAYFDFVDFDYDIDEAITDYNNGSYLISFRSEATRFFTTGNYSTQILTYFGDTNRTDDFQLNILSYDNIPPSLSVIQPVSNITYTTYMFVNLTGFDDVGWQELRISFREVEIFRLLQTEEPLGRGEWNQTHLKFERYVYFDVRSGPDEIKITLIDTSLNEVSVIRNSAGDAELPVVDWVRPLNAEIFVETEILLLWEASDNDALSGFEIFVNNYPILVTGPTNRTATINLPVALEEVTSIELLIIATDVSGNSQQSSIIITYDPNHLDEYEERISNAQIITTILTVLLVAVSIGVVFITFLLIRQSLSSRKSKAKYRGMHDSFPSEMLNQILDQHNLENLVSTQLEMLFSSFQSKLKKLNKSHIQNEIDKLKIEMMGVLDQSENEDLTKFLAFTIDGWVSNLGNQ